MAVAEIGADKIPQIMVYNKIDRLDSVSAHIDKDETGQTKAVWLSAIKGEGIDLLLKSLSGQCHGENIRLTITLTSQQAKLRARLFEHGQILNEVVQENGDWTLDLNISARFSYLLDEIQQHNEDGVH